MTFRKRLVERGILVDSPFWGDGGTTQENRATGRGGHQQENSGEQGHGAGCVLKQVQ